jgi:hypothetical protein
MIWIEELIDIAETEASSQLYGVLKRPDEKFVTERAYDNPKFVEDLARDVAVALNSDDRVTSYVVEVENFESIHNHSAYALIEGPPEKDTPKNGASGPTTQAPPGLLSHLSRRGSAADPQRRSLLFELVHLVDVRLVLGLVE